MHTLTTTNNLDSISTGEAAFLGGFLGTALVFGLIFTVLVIVGEWKVFEKAGEKGWKCLIPIYGQYILFKIIGLKNLFWAFLCISVIASIMMTANTPPIDYNAPQAEITAQIEVIDWSAYTPFVIGAVITCITSIVVGIIVAVRLAKAFGKGAAYILGLIFIPEIVLVVLGFGSAKYSAKNLK